MKTYSFPASRRIRKRKEFLAVYAKGKKMQCARYLLFSDIRPGEPQRVGLAVSRKIGNAVARNRTRRVLREFFRLLDFSIPGAQIVAVAKPGAATLNLAEASAQLQPLLLRMAGIKNKD